MYTFDLRGTDPTPRTAPSTSWGAYDGQARPTVVTAVTAKTETPSPGPGRSRAPSGRRRDAHSGILTTSREQTEVLGSVQRRLERELVSRHLCASCMDSFQKDHCKGQTPTCSKQLPVGVVGSGRGRTRNKGRDPWGGPHS